MKVRLALPVLAACAALLAAPQARAGIADSPLPVLSAGATTLYLYSVLGVTDNGAVATIFTCTSTDAAAQQVGVEIFPSPGGGPNNDAAATSVSVGPGASVTFGTSSNAMIGLSSIVGGTGSPSRPGSARILSTSKKLACSALVIERSGFPPTVTWPLTIIAKLKQKAAN